MKTPVIDVIEEMDAPGLNVKSVRLREKGQPARPTPINKARQSEKVVSPFLKPAKRATFVCLGRNEVEPGTNETEPRT